VSATPRLLSTYRFLERIPLGREVFSQGFRLAAPYFRTIPAWIESVEPGVVVAQMRHAPWVRNHLGTVHAIAGVEVFTATITIWVTRRGA
jgi:uncharacterized protein DUF4442